MKTTGEKIRESRTHLGLTQTELADKIGVTLRTITKYEKQGVMPRGVNLQSLFSHGHRFTSCNTGNV